VCAWRPAVPAISEVFHARFIGHRYPPHTHDDWTVFIVDDGAIHYDLDSRKRGAGRGLVTLLPPHVVHDGRSASEYGYRKRVLYVSTDLLGPNLTGRAVDDPDIDDAILLRKIRKLHVLLEHPDEALAAEAAVGVVGERIRLHLGDREESEKVPHRDEELAGSLRELLDAHLFEAVTLADAGQALGATTPRLVRALGRTYGISPHRYLIARRIEAARKRLLDGEPVAETAAAIGFHDQAHFTRHFRRHVGETPARFARSRPS
jgi:AraC-like DNA-binding protein